MFTKFTLIGLPGVGKSTITKECVRHLQLMGIDCDIKSTDEMIYNRFKADDPIILKFQNKIGSIPPNIFNSDRPISAFIAYFGEEPIYRDLEELFIKSFLQTFNEKDWLDIGGKAPLRQQTLQALLCHQIIPIFLYASKDTLIARLQNEDNWQKRNNYHNAGMIEWKKLAESHYIERLPQYCAIAPIIINVNASSERLQTTSQSRLSEEKKTTSAKSPSELTREIFYRIKEFQLICTDTERRNSFSSRNSLFFAPRCNDLPDASDVKNPIICLY